MTDLEIRRVEQAFPSALRGREHRLFAGVVQMKGTPLWGRIFWRLIGGREGDHRNWPAIAHWAQSIAAELSQVPTARMQPRG